MDTPQQQTPARRRSETCDVGLSRVVRWVTMYASLPSMVANYWLPVSSRLTHFVDPLIARSKVSNAVWLKLFQESSCTIYTTFRGAKLHAGLNHPLLTDSDFLITLMYSPRQNDPPMNSKNYDPHANQWMHEAMESRQTIEELKAHNEKLQRDVYTLNSNMNLLHECLGELKIVDRVGDLMQKKIRAFQLAQHARVNAPPSNAAGVSPRMARRLSDPTTNPRDDSVICGSSAFHCTAAYSSSYEGQIARDTFHRKNMFETDGKDKYDIFGNTKALPLVHDARRGDAIDSLLSNGGAVRQQASPMAAATFKPHNSH